MATFQQWASRWAECSTTHTFMQNVVQTKINDTSTSLTLSTSEGVEVVSAPFSSSSSSSSSPSSMGPLEDAWLLLWSLSFLLFLLLFFLRPSKGSLDRGRWMWWEEWRWSRGEADVAHGYGVSHEPGFQKHHHRHQCGLTFDVLLVVVVVLLVRHRSSGAEDVLEALDSQSFVQVSIVLLFGARRPV